MTSSLSAGGRLGWRQRISIGSVLLPVPVASFWKTTRYLVDWPSVTN